MRSHRFVTRLAGLALALAAPAGLAAAPDLPLERVEATLAVEPAPARAGAAAEVLVELTIESGWHIQAGEGSGDEQPPYIATTVSTSLPTGWTQGAVHWPEAHQFSLGFGAFAEELAGYEGTATLRLPITVPADAAAGAHAVSVTVGYQACDDSICEAPTQVEVTGTVMVAEGTPAAEGAGGDSSAVLRGSIAWFEGEINPGGRATMGLVLETTPGWHIQAGAGSGREADFAESTTVDVQLPGGWSAEDVQWPPPHEFELPGVGTLFGYTGRFVVVVPVTVAADATIDGARVVATVHYQACDATVCDRPADLLVESTVDPAVVDDELRDLFQATLAHAPAVDGAAPRATGEPDGFSLSRSKWWLSLAFVWAACLWMIWRTWRITRRVGPRVTTTTIGALLMFVMFAFTRAISAPSDFNWVHYDHETFDSVRAENTVLIKFTADWCPNCLVNERLIMSEDDLVARMQAPGVVSMKVDFTAPDKEGQERLDAVGGGGIPVIAVYPKGSNEPIVIRGQLASTRPVRDALAGLGVAEDANRVVFDVLGWRFSLGREALAIGFVLAFAAGFFLNFTPCVLPVIPLKILSLKAHAHDPRRCLALGVSFALGILAVFAVLGILIAGLSFGWGDQFQKWWLNALIGVIVGVMGFGMLGLFVIRLPKAVYMLNPQSDSHGGSVAMGAFTAVLSTPCTGPLLGGVLAMLASQPAWVGFSAFLVMGAGMAFPYLLLTAKPSLLDRMPRTGPGSELIKQVMGLFLLAVAVYFVGTALVSLTV